jgi:hypothetical protein
LEFIAAIWYISWPFDNLVAIWYIFLRFGIFSIEKIWQPWREHKRRRNGRKSEVSSNLMIGHQGSGVEKEGGGGTGSIHPFSIDL